MPVVLMYVLRVVATFPASSTICESLITHLRRRWRWGEDSTRPVNDSTCQTETEEEVTVRGGGEGALTRGSGFGGNRRNKHTQTLRQCPSARTTTRSRCLFHCSSTQTTTNCGHTYGQLLRSERLFRGLATRNPARASKSCESKQIQRLEASSPRLD